MEFMRNLMLCALLAGGLIFVTGAMLGRAADKEPTLEEYAKAGQPGPEHKKLDPLVGSWTFTMKMWMDPSKPPIEAKGTSESKWILGGRYVHQEVQSESFGDKFTGIGVSGYDNAQGKYVMGWIDSMGTGIETMTGTVDKDGKVFTWTGEHLDPVTKKKIKGKDVIKIESNDKYTWESYKEVDGKEIKMMEIVSIRKK
jgi:hypothetical protein